jgi:hypothetical protein
VSTTFPGDHVQKSGRTTGHTTGVVTSDELSLRVTDPTFGTAEYRRQIAVRNDVEWQPFQAPGDSGAVLVNDNRRLVGLMFATLRESSAREYGVANTIQDVLRALDVHQVLAALRRTAPQRCRTGAPAASRQARPQRRKG